VSFVDSPFTEKRAYEAACALPPAEREAAFIAATKSGSGHAAISTPTMSGLVEQPDFFVKESGAPLLRRNAGFLSAEGLPDGLRARLDSWPTLAGAVAPADEVCAQ
jgi:hypothetical protein